MSLKLLFFWPIVSQCARFLYSMPKRQQTLPEGTEVQKWFLAHENGKTYVKRKLIYSDGAISYQRLPRKQYKQLSEPEILDAIKSDTLRANYHRAIGLGSSAARGSFASRPMPQMRSRSLASTMMYRISSRTAFRSGFWLNLVAD